jgi:hypothetical protein
LVLPPESQYARILASLEQYEQGATSFTTVLTAEQNLLQAQNSLAGASANVPLGLTAVFRALGAGGRYVRAATPSARQQLTRCVRERTCFRLRTNRRRRLRACQVLGTSGRRFGHRSGNCRGAKTCPSSSTKRELSHEMYQASFAVICILLAVPLSLSFGRLNARNADHIAGRETDQRL